MPTWHVMLLWHFQTFCFSQAKWDKKYTDLGESTWGSASTVQEPDDSQPKSLWSGIHLNVWQEVGSSWLGHHRSMLPPYTAQKMMPDEAEIGSDSKMSLVVKKKLSEMGSNPTVCAQLNLIRLNKWVVMLFIQRTSLIWNLYFSFCHPS